MTLHNGIKVYLRVRPTKKPSGFLELNDEEPGRVEFNIPHDIASNHVNNTRQNYRFKFDGVIDESAKQEDVFDVVARDATLNALEGFNATVFAYGQTGSGKTFTVTGGPDSYQDRGLIPRALSMIFSEVERRTDYQINVHVTYLEIYNNNGFDLLDPSHESKACLEDLPRVSMMEDDDGNVHLKNLSMHLANSEEDALNLLFLGDTNRAISETPMNLASSRSHCIFTISLEMRQNGSDVIRRSKLNLVDLAGSERVHKTNSGGQLLREAKHINSSLHFLEMVIVALNERQSKGRQHIPYRNSMVTNVLRDSLGGNCKTSMIATISAEKPNTEETISTCKFAQRVALVENDALVNEELDPTMLIKRLKAENAALKEELAFLKGERNPEGIQGGDRVDALEHKRLRNIIEDWVASSGRQESKHVDEDEEPSDKLNPGPLTFERIHACFEILRDMAGSGSVSTGSYSTQGSSSEEVNQLKQQIQQRDNEIAVLVNMVKQKKTDGAGDIPETKQPESREDDNNIPVYREMVQEVHEREQQQTQKSRGVAPVPPSEVLADKSRALEYFKSYYPQIRVMNENKRVLREKYALAKQTGEMVNSSRREINRLKSEIEQIRTQNALQDIVDENTNEEKRADNREQDKMDEIARHKHSYKSNFQNLKELKRDIERIQAILGNSRMKMQKEFESWYSVMLRQGLSDDNGDYSNGDHDIRVEQAVDVPIARKSGTSSILPSKAVVKTQKTPVPADVPLTGNSEADEDIMAFYKAKEQLLRRSKLK